MFEKKPEITVTSQNVGRHTTNYATWKWEAVAAAGGFRYTGRAMRRGKAEKIAVDGLRKLMKSRRTRRV